MSFIDVTFGDETQLRMLSGVDQLVDTVRSTLGPKGRNVLIESPSGPPSIVSQGSSVAEQVTLTDRLENVGAQLAKEGASRTRAQAGDGTTTTLLIMQSILQQAARTTGAGISARELADEIAQAVQFVAEEVASYSEPFEPERAASIAGNAAHDAEIGEFVSAAFQEVDHDDVIEFADSSHLDLSRSLTHGMHFDAGFARSDYISGDEAIVLENPYVLVTNSIIRTSRELQPMLEEVAQANRPLLIVSSGIGEEPAKMLVANFQRGTVRAVCVCAPGQGEEQRVFLEDLAIYTDGPVALVEGGTQLSAIGMDMLGHAQRAIIRRRETNVLEPRGDGKARDLALRRIESQLQTVQDEAERSVLNRRRKSLRGLTMLIGVGGATEVVKLDRRKRVERAIAALRAASEGVVAGGGVALLRAGDSLAAAHPGTDRNAGHRIVRRACEAVVRQLAVNSGYEGQAVIARIRDSHNLSFGFNVTSGRFEDLMMAGVIDPVTTVVASFCNAAQIAALIMTAGAAIIEHKTRAANSAVKRSRYQESRTLSWPPGNAKTAGIRAFANIHHPADVPINVGNTILLEAGFEQEFPVADLIPPEEGEPLCSVALSAPSMKLESESIQEVSFRWGSRATAMFRLTFEASGRIPILVEFYCNRVWLGQIPLEVHVVTAALEDRVTEYAG